METTLIRKKFEKLKYIVDTSLLLIVIIGEEYELGYRVTISINEHSYHFNGFKSKTIFDTLRYALIELEDTEYIDILKQVIYKLRKELK